MKPETPRALEARRRTTIPIFVAAAGVLSVLPSGCSPREDGRDVRADRFEAVMIASADTTRQGLQLRAIPVAESVSVGNRELILYTISSPGHQVRVRIDPGLLLVRVSDAQGNEVKPEVWEEAPSLGDEVWLAIPANGFFGRQIDLTCFDLSLDASSARNAARCRAHWALRPGAYQVSVGQEVFVRTAAGIDTVELRATPFRFTVRP